MNAPQRLGRAAVVGGLAMLLAGALPCPAQVVQLPTFEFFGVSTTVMVPDRGGLTAAGVARGRSTSHIRGIPVGPAANDLFAAREASGLGVTATVHDLAELDRQILASAPRASAPRVRLAGAEKESVTRVAIAEQKNPSSANRPAQSLTSIRANRSKEGEAKNALARNYLQQAENARDDGGAALARMYYQMAVRRASGELSAHIAGRLASLPR
jgi:hypothetical protein